MVDSAPTNLSTAYPDPKASKEEDLRKPKGNTGSLEKLVYGNLSMSSL